MDDYYHISLSRFIIMKPLIREEWILGSAGSAQDDDVWAAKLVSRASGASVGRDGGGEGGRRDPVLLPNRR